MCKLTLHQLNYHENIQLTGLPQYEIAVTIGGYTNPRHSRQSCSSSVCFRACCDGHDGSGGCHRCDSFFTYCLKDIDTLTPGCPEGGTIMMSDVNPNDASIDFSQNTVLGLDNPLVFQGINHTWNVSINPCRSSQAIFFHCPCRESSCMSEFGIRIRMVVS